MHPLEYLIKNREIFNISGVEKAANIRPTMLHKYLKSGKMREKYKKQLAEYLARIAFKNEDAK